MLLGQEQQAWNPEPPIRLNPNMAFNPPRPRIGNGSTKQQIAVSRRRRLFRVLGILDSRRHRGVEEVASVINPLSAANQVPGVCHGAAKMIRANAKTALKETLDPLIQRYLRGGCRQGLLFGPHSRHFFPSSSLCPTIPTHAYARLLILLPSYHPEFAAITLSALRAVAGGNAMMDMCRVPMVNGPSTLDHQTEHPYAGKETMCGRLASRYIASLVTGRMRRCDQVRAQRP
jgi:hypothetical protein